MAESPVKELDELTQLRIELRAAQLKRARNPLLRGLRFSVLSPWLLFILYGGVVYTLDMARDPQFGYLLTYLGAFVVASALVSSHESRTDERLKELERRLDSLAEELKKRG